MHGLQVRDSNGQMVLDTTDRVSIILGSFDTGTSSGVHTDSDLDGGNPFIFIPPTNDGINYVLPTVTISGSRISWEFNREYRESRDNASVTIYYGFYS